NEAFPVTCGRRSRIHAFHARSAGVGGDDNRFTEPLRRSDLVDDLFDRVDWRIALLAVVVQEINYRELPRRIARVTWRQVHCDVAVRRFTLAIPFKRFAMHGYVLGGARPSGRAGRAGSAA